MSLSGFDHRRCSDGGDPLLYTWKYLKALCTQCPLLEIASPLSALQKSHGSPLDSTSRFALQIAAYKAAGPDEKNKRQFVWQEVLSTEHENKGMKLLLKIHVA